MERDALLSHGVAFCLHDRWVRCVVFCCVVLYHVVLCSTAGTILAPVPSHHLPLPVLSFPLTPDSWIVLTTILRMSVRAVAGCYRSTRSSRRQHLRACCMEVRQISCTCLHSVICYRAISELLSCHSVAVLIEFNDTLWSLTTALCLCQSLCILAPVEPYCNYLMLLTYVLSASMSVSILCLSTT